jgi:transcriptional regulator with XRE-family HTH domain
MKKQREDALAKKVGKAIADRRKAVSITQEELATTLDVGIEAISRMERGVIMPSITRLVEVAEALDCPVQSLLNVGSDRAVDYGIQLAKLLNQIKPKDREVLLSIVEQLITKFK